MVVVPIGAGLVAALVVSTHSVGVFFVVAAIAAVALTIGTLVLADSRAKSAFLQAWASARGWSADSSSWIDGATPLLRYGDRRLSGHHISGPLATGETAVLCHYTYEVRPASTVEDRTSTSLDRKSVV